MTDNLLNASPAEITEAADGVNKPDWLPTKFWDEQKQDVRVESLAKAYLALEKRLHGQNGQGSAKGAEAGPAIPKSPDAYRLNLNSIVKEADPVVNQRLHKAGFTEEQAQLVYDLAAERLMPAAEALAADFEAERQLARLVDHFGGEDAWAETARQLETWGKSNLPPQMMSALTTTYEGVMALYGMMNEGGEPGLKGTGGGAMGTLTEEDLRAMMKDARYWRERDPALINKVAAGFKRLYPGKI